VLQVSLGYADQYLYRHVAMGYILFHIDCS